MLLVYWVCCTLQWLQEQLAHIGNLHISGADEEEDEWVDPSGGLLVNIFAACEEGSLEQLATNIQDLKETAYNLDTPGPDGDTALHLACLYGRRDCAELLLQEGCKADPVNPEDGTTPLHDAAAGGYLDIVKLLLSKSGTSMINCQDADGDTALHNAARGGHLEVVQYLLHQGALPSIVNSSSKTAAGESDNPDVVRALVAAAAAALRGMPTAVAGAGAGAGTAAAAASGPGDAAMAAAESQQP